MEFKIAYKFSVQFDDKAHLKLTNQYGVFSMFLGLEGWRGEVNFELVVYTLLYLELTKCYKNILSKTFANSALQTEEWIFGVVVYISYPGGKLGLFTKNVLGLELSAYGHHVQCQFLT